MTLYFITVFWGPMQGSSKMTPTQTIHFTIIRESLQNSYKWKDNHYKWPKIHGFHWGLFHPYFSWVITITLPETQEIQGTRDLNTRVGGLPNSRIARFLMVFGGPGFVSQPLLEQYEISGVHHKHQALHDRINYLKIARLLWDPWWYRVSPIF